MIGYYNYSVILTYFGLISSLLGISYLYSGDKGGIIVSIILLMVSGVCDMFDGAIAHRCKRCEEAKMFGIQIDSLCDLVCFGVFPGIMVYKISGHTAFSKIALVIIVLSSVIRLGYFNVQETMRDKSERRELYEGLPVTLTAAFIPLMIVIGAAFNLKYSYLLPIALIVEAGSELVKIPVKKPYGIGKAIVAVIGILIIAGVFVFKSAIIESVI